VSRVTLSQQYEIVGVKDVDQVWLTFPVTAAARALEATRKLRGMGYTVRMRLQATVHAVAT
jgi:hypothetical protein